MALQRVTITGADDSTSIGELADLTAVYPFVEWGILVSPRAAINGPLMQRVQKVRFPSAEWLLRFMDRAADGKWNVALHVCGYWTLQLASGQLGVVPRWMTDVPQRIQLNFHGEPHGGPPGSLRSATDAWSDKEIIYQIDGLDGDRLFGVNCGLRQNVVPLFDLSHGAGVLPHAWPAPIVPDGRWQGYAGGLGPENIRRQLPRIVEAAGEHPYWIDMETKVRTPGGQYLDLGAVASVLHVASSSIVSTT